MASNQLSPEKPASPIQKNWLQTNDPTWEPTKMDNRRPEQSSKKQNYVPIYGKNLMKDLVIEYGIPSHAFQMEFLQVLVTAS